MLSKAASFPAAFIHEGFIYPLYNSVVVPKRN